MSNGCSSFITKLYSSESFTVAERSLETAPTEPVKKETYLFESENLLPIDWSLKTRVRFLSTKQFSCYSGIRSQHESEALLNYSKYNGFYASLEENKYVCWDLFLTKLLIPIHLFFFLILRNLLKKTIACSKRFFVNRLATGRFLTCHGWICIHETSDWVILARSRWTLL